VNDDNLETLLRSHVRDMREWRAYVNNILHATTLKLQEQDKVVREAVGRLDAKQGTVPATPLWSICAVLVAICATLVALSCR
jgi:hypothetical protein